MPIQCASDNQRYQFSFRLVQFDSVFFECKMNLTKFFVANLISIANLTLFLDRLITDGKYKSVSVFSDDESVQIFPELADRVFGKHTMVIQEYCNRLPPEFAPIHHSFGSLQLMLISNNAHVDDLNNTVWIFAHRSFLFNPKENLLVLIPMQSDERKKKIWNLLVPNYRHFNCSVVFYQTERSMQMANTSRKPIQIYIMNSMYEQIDRNVKEIDVDNIGVNDSRNLNDRIFGTILKKRILIIPTKTAHNGSSIKSVEGRGNRTLVNLGSADYYLSNFIARNLRTTNVYIEQTIEFKEYNIFKRAKVFFCDAANETIYAELYNEIPKKPQYNRFVPIPFSIQFLRALDTFSVFVYFNSFILHSVPYYIYIVGSHKYSRLGYPLMSHGGDDCVFIIFQHGTRVFGMTRRTKLDILQWFIFIFVAALILYGLRKMIVRREGRLIRRIDNDAAPDYFLGSFADSMGVFLGVALNTISRHRAERWFLISFSIFGMFFKIFFTDNLFVMLTEPIQNRITSIEQLFQQNLPMNVDPVLSQNYFIKIGG